MTRNDGIGDELIATGLKAAIEKTLVPALVERAYPGHFTVVADGSHFGAEATWPGLDSWEMAGAYLLLGKKRAVLDYFAFVRASQRGDGNIPFAIFPADGAPEGMESYLRGLRWPEDAYRYFPPGRPVRKWIGLFEHWQRGANPLSVLGAISYILTAGDIVGAGASQGWARENFSSIERAGEYVVSRKSPNGLISGAGFYIECPPRNQWDGVTQCYAIRGFRVLSQMADGLGLMERALYWRSRAEELTRTFHQMFWREDHFAEYVHPKHGVVDLRGLTDVNWAAIGLGVATDEQARIVWPRLMGEASFWQGGMPTQLASLSARYEEWELPEPLPFIHKPGPVYDVAAMGRVWFLEAMACKRMGEMKRIEDSVRLVCEMGERSGWKWHERYHVQENGSVKPAGPGGYCEYAAILVRVVMGILGGDNLR